MLVKFCKPEHNLLNGCNTIRFGTLEYYRSLDPSYLISDMEEGVDNHLVNHSNQIPSNAECISFLKSVGFYSNDTDFHIQGIQFRRTFPNCYIWCCKQMDSEPKSTDGNQFDTDYSSHYKIPDQNAFAKYLGNILNSSVKRRNFSILAQETLDSLSIAEYGNVSLQCFHSPVVYVEKKDGELSFGRYRSYAENIPPNLRPLFVKPRKFQEDSEYRFVFIFTCNHTGKVLPVNLEPLDLNCMPISK